MVDYDEVLALAKESPAEADRLRRLGLPAHGRDGQVPRDRRRGGALLLCDMAHFAGLVAAGLHPNPVRALRLRHLDDAQDARRPAFRLHPLQEEHAQAVDRRSSRGCKAARCAHVAAKATCFKIAGDARLPRVPGPGARRTRTRLAETLQEGGLDVLTGGTDTHLLQVDLRATEWTRQGRRGAAARGQASPSTGTPFRSTSGRRCSRLGHPHRDARRDHARLRRGRLPRGGRRSSSARSQRAPTWVPSARRAKRCAGSGRSIRASAASRPTSPERGTK